MLPHLVKITRYSALQKQKSKAEAKANTWGEGGVHYKAIYVTNNELLSTKNGEGGGNRGIQSVAVFNKYQDLIA